MVSGMGQGPSSGKEPKAEVSCELWEGTWVEWGSGWEQDLGSGREARGGTWAGSRDWS